MEAWYRRLCERDAYREHVMVPFGELRSRLESYGALWSTRREFADTRVDLACRA